MLDKGMEGVILSEWLSSHCIDKEKKHTGRAMHVKIEMPEPFYELWQGIKNTHGLDDDFLSYMASKMIQRCLIICIGMEGMGE